jgi:hypothetical protein
MRRERAGFHTRRPQHGVRRDRLDAELDEVGGEIGNGRPRTHLHAEPLELLPRALGEARLPLPLLRLPWIWPAMTPVQPGRHFESAKSM